MSSAAAAGQGPGTGLPGARGAGPDRHGRPPRGAETRRSLCDLTIAFKNARFGPTVPRVVGSFDAGYGAACLARVVGEKRAREIWFLTDQYDAETAERWGLVNRVVPLAELHESAQGRGERIAAMSPTTLRFLTHAFNADTAHVGGISRVAYAGLDLFTTTDEAHEGTEAFNQKRAPDSARFRS